MKNNIKDIEKNIFNWLIKFMWNYYIPWYYYKELENGKIEVVWVAADSGYLWDYGNQSPDLSTSLDLLKIIWLKIEENNIGEKDENEDFYPLIEPIILDKLIIL